jgi:Protein of unknown function (DUF2637)
VPQTHTPANAARAVIITAALAAPLVCALAVLGGIGSFTTIRDLARPWFGDHAWIVPAGIDLGILALLAWDLLAEYLGLPWPVLRWTAWAFIAATVYLNIAAAHGSATAAVMHAAMPVLFITVTEGIRHLIRQLTGLASGTRIERVPGSRWLLAPRSTAALTRRMVLWHVTSYRDGLALEHQHLQTVCRLQQDYGRWRWRWRAPLQDRLTLRLMPADPRAGLAPPPAEPQLNDHGARLVEATAEILAEAERDGTALTQSALARLLRERGLRVANDRLHWLVTTARAESTRHSETA